MDAHDKKNLDVLSSIIKKGDVIVDVGANHGTYTDFFKRNLDGSGKIYCIELHPKTYGLLVQKYIGNSNIGVINKAISNIDGEMTYHSGEDDCLQNILGHDVNYKPSNIMGKTESIRLDTFLKYIEHINLIKIDVEGAELMVLEGLENIINKVDYILVECHLNKDWDLIKNLLINKYKLTCFNKRADDIENREITIHTSKMAYQCFCKNVK